MLKLLPLYPLNEGENKLKSILARQIPSDSNSVYKIFSEMSPIHVIID
jgi:hypothetical protein